MKSVVKSLGTKSGDVAAPFAATSDYGVKMQLSQSASNVQFKPAVKQPRPSRNASHATWEQRQLQLMLYGAQQWDKSPSKHKFRERNRTKEIVKQEFVALKELKK